MLKNLILNFKLLFSGFSLKKSNQLKINSHRKPVKSNKIYVCIHEWGGYKGHRIKKVKKIRSFECGLDYQLDRFKKEKLSNDIELIVTLSDSHLYKNIDNLKTKCDHLFEVSNQGFDFSGYSFFYNYIRNKPNAYIILTNSSVNKIISPFLKNYIDYMNNNPDVGLLGISCNKRFYHTFAFNNFNPHLQSFFLLTTIDVLNQAVHLNMDQFPGSKETNKHLLIRNGEVKLSSLILQLGYKLAVVTPEDVIKFDYTYYPFPNGDIRHKYENPNTIFPIKI